MPGDDNVYNKQIFTLNGTNYNEKGMKIKVMRQKPFEEP